MAKKASKPARRPTRTWYVNVRIRVRSVKSQEGVIDEIMSNLPGNVTNIDAHVCVNDLVGASVSPKLLKIMAIFADHREDTGGYRTTLNWIAGELHDEQAEDVWNLTESPGDGDGDKGCWDQLHQRLTVELNHLIATYGGGISVYQMSDAANNTAAQKGTL